MALDRVHTGGQLSLVQDRVDRALAPSPGAIGSGVLIEDVSLTGGTSKDIAHRLGRPPMGVIPVKMSNNGTWTVVDAADPSSFITVTCSATGTFSFWVF